MRVKGRKWDRVLNSVLGIGVMIGVWSWGVRGWEWMNGECVVRVDCRGRGIGVEWMKEWEDGADGKWGLGVKRMAGWRVEVDEVVSSVKTGREERTQVIGVYGVMELVEPVEVLCGRYGLVEEDGYCVVSEGLAEALFGSVEIAGEEVLAGEKKLVVAGVIEKGEEVLLLPVNEGEMEMLAVEVQGRMGAKEKVEGMMNGM